MAVSRLNKGIVSEVADMRREMVERKNRQPIGSSQIVMKVSETNRPWDITLAAVNSGQYPGAPGWNVAIVTAEAVNSNNLIADLAVDYSIAMPIESDIIDIPLPTHESRKKEWFIPIFAPQGSSVSLKAQVIANDDVIITARQA